MSELEELRNEVRLSELRRSIPYASQTDHSAHTLYNYLLGIYLVLWDDELRKGFAEYLSEEPESQPFLEVFLFRWLYVSLLHDVGYVFQSPVAAERRTANRFFRHASVNRLLQAVPPAAQATRASIQTAIQDPKFRPSYPADADPESTLDVLRQLPWASEVGLQADAFDVFVGSSNAPCLMLTELERFAYQVAVSGYNGDSAGVVDHGVASGLFLLQYCSWWFWLAKVAKYAPPFESYRDNDHLVKSVAPACAAVATHNMIGAHAPKGKLMFGDDPFMYLGILCDELQRWDRYPAGEAHFRQLEMYSTLGPGSEFIHLQPGSPVRMYFPNKDLLGRVIKGLGRLDDYQRVVRLGLRKH